MTDPFDVRRQLDHEAAEQADEAMDKLGDSKDDTDERNARLVRLDDEHYFDPKENQVLLKDGGQYRNLGHIPVELKRAVEVIERAALRRGFIAIADRLFWHPRSKHLFVKNGGHFVFYSRDRRQRARAMTA